MNSRLLFLLLLTSFHLQAQMEQPLVFEQIEGLSQNTVYSITRDKQGFMWIATADGLNRYDGVEMKTFKPPSEKKVGYIEGRVIRTRIIEDDQEQLWFSTEASVNSLNKKTGGFANYYFGEEQIKNWGINANPLLLKENNLWLANSGYGIIEFNTITNKHQHYPLEKIKGQNFLIHQEGIYDNKTRLWFASNNGLKAFNIQTKKWEHYLHGQNLFGITHANDTIYAGKGNLVIYFAIKSGMSGTVAVKNWNADVKNEIFRSFYTDKMHTIWAGDENGNVFRKLPNKGSFECIGNINGANRNAHYPVYCFYMDDHGTLWIGADVLGLLRTNIKGNGFNTYPGLPDAKNNNSLMVLSINEDEKGRIYLGTFQKGVIVLDKNSGKSSSLKLSLPSISTAYSNMASLLTTDSRGNFWIGYAGYLFVKEKGRDTFRPLKIPVPENSLQQFVQVSCLAEYKNGWLVGTQLGLYFLSENNMTYKFEHFPGFGQTRISALWVNGEKEVWIGYESRAIDIITDFQHIEKGRKLFPNIGIKSILSDVKNKMVWVSTLSGLIAYHLPTEQYKIFTEEDGMLNSYVYAALPHKNELWISTNNGLSQAKLQYNPGSVFPEVAFTNFTTADGLPDNEFNTGAYHKGKDGYLYFGTLKGAVWFNTEHIQSSEQVPQIRMINLMVNEEKADSIISPEYISKLSLPYFKNNLFFRFRGIEYNNPQKVNYAYMLEGWDNNWVYSKTLNEVRYNSLPHGNYLFKLKASNSSGVWSKDIYSVRIIIHPPFWKTWWFYSLMGFLLFASILILTRTIFQKKLRKKIELLERQSEIDKERQRISREMHDDIGAGLTQIALMSESVKNKSNAISREKLDDISDTSRKLVSNIGEIIWSLNPENKTLEQLLSYMREQLNKQLEYSGISYTIKLPDTGKNILLTNEQRRNILLITKEIINNAMKYSEAKNISIEAVLNNGFFTSTIRDDGKGFDTSQTFSGNGLKNIKHRVKELAGELQIESSPGKGTRFVCIIPVKTTT